MSGCGAIGTTALMESARKGDAAKTKKLIENGVDLDKTNKYGWTALMFAAKEGHVPVVDLLLEAGVDPNIESERITGNTQAPYPKTTALREAIGGGHLSVAKTLIDRGAKVDATAFAMAGGAGDVTLLKKMMAEGADPNLPSPGPYRFYPSAICVASSKGKLEAVRWLVENGADPNLIAMECLALRAAVNGGHVGVVEYLLENGANPDLLSGPDQVTPLFHCVTAHTRSGRYDKDLKILRVLLERGADRNVKSGKPRISALDHAKDQLSRLTTRPASASNLELIKKLEAVITALDEE
jgi:ankyrin repeat protein